MSSDTRAAEPARRLIPIRLRELLIEEEFEAPATRRPELRRQGRVLACGWVRVADQGGYRLGERAVLVTFGTEQRVLSPDVMVLAPATRLHHRLDASRWSDPLPEPGMVTVGDAATRKAFGPRHQASR